MLSRAVCSPNHVGPIIKHKHTTHWAHRNTSTPHSFSVLSGYHRRSGCCLQDPQGAGTSPRFSGSAVEHTGQQTFFIFQGTLTKLSWDAVARLPCCFKFWSMRQTSLSEGLIEPITLVVSPPPAGGRPLQKNRPAKPSPKPAKIPPRSVSRTQQSDSGLGGKLFTNGHRLPRKFGAPLGLPPPRNSSYLISKVGGYTLGCPPHVGEWE